MLSGLETLNRIVAALRAHGTEVRGIYGWPTQPFRAVCQQYPMAVGVATCHVRRGYCEPSDFTMNLAGATVDEAGDLAEGVPTVWVAAVAGDLDGPLDFLVAAQAFVEQEAEAACRLTAGIVAETCWGVTDDKVLVSQQ